jgi:hypothetical protein
MSGADPEDDQTRAPRPLMGPAFWIALAFGLACVIGGLVLAKLGPVLF